MFVEVQFQPQEDFYRRVFAEVFLYLHRSSQPRPWRVVVVYPEISAERIPLGYESLLELPEVRRVDLMALRGCPRATPGWGMLQLLICEPAEAAAQARELLRNRIERQQTAEWRDLVEFVETILVYKLPRLRREEIQAMLGLQDIDLKETRFYQDVFAEGRTEGRTEGEARVLRRQLTRRFGPLPAWVEAKLAGAGSDQLEAWADRVLETTTLEEIFE